MPGITERISLDGGDEINAIFAGIFKAGVDAFNGLKGAARDLGLDKELTPQFERAKKSTVDFGDGFKKTIKAIGDGVNDFANASAKISGAVVAIGAALFGLTKSASSAAHEVEQAARRTGQTTGEYQRLAFGFKETGVEAGELTRAFAKISQEATKAAAEGKQSTGAWEKYGIALRGADGHARSITAILSDVADVMAKTESPTERAGIAAELFGARVGTKMVGLLAQGSAGMRAMAADAEKLGIVLSEHDIEAGTKFEQAMVRMGGTLDATRIKFGLAFAPGFTELVNSIADAFGRLQPYIVGAGQAVANFLAPYLKDIAAVLSGNAQQIQTGFVQVLYNAFVSIGAVIRGAGVIVQGWIVILQQVGAVVDSVFGEGFSARFLSGAAAALALAVAFGTLFKSVQLLAGGFGLLLRLVGLGSALTPVGLAIVAIAAAIGLVVVALSQVDWAKFAEAAQAAWNSIVTAVQNVVTSITGFFTGWFDWFAQKINEAANAFARLFPGGGTPGNAQAALGGASVVTAAGGGLLRGPGTSTSDSIPLWGSTGEYMVQAKAVRRVGIGFMHAINNMKVPRFALGGLIEAPRLAPAMAPLRLAAGGPVTGRGTPLTLVLDGRRFEGLTAPEHVADSLKSHAISRQVASTGRKPSWLR
jgi:hypothetical protein